MILSLFKFKQFLFLLTSVLGNMSSMTIDQLKKSLTEQGVTLPPPRSKKADYLKLYKQYSTINDSLGDAYSSDDENPPRTSSQSVTSSSSPSKNENIAKEVELLSDDELYHRLKEFDAKIGPVLKNTRRVYEKKLIKILTSGKQTNGYENIKQNEKFITSVDEFSDSDVEIGSKSARKTETKGRKSSVLRDSPKPSVSELLRPEIETSFSSNYEYNNQSSASGYSREVKPSRFSYIETVPKGSSYSYIEPDTEADFPSSDVRQRFTDRYGVNTPISDKYSTNRTKTDDIYKPSIGLGGSYKSGLGGGDYEPGFKSSNQYRPSLGLSSQYKSGGGFGDAYTGTWEPNINRYLNTGIQQKKGVTTAKGYNIGAWFKNLLAALLLLTMLLLIIYIYHQWSSTDPYKMIEDDAERQIQELSEGSGSF